MPTLAELLKSAGIAEDVAAGVPKEVAAAIETHLTAADTTFKSASEKEEAAREALRISGLKEKEITEYVEKYGTSLTTLANTQAENKALRTYLESLKAQGFEVEIPAAGAAPKSAPTAAGGNVDENTILTKVRGEAGMLLSSYVDINNEHIRLYGTPIPDDAETLFAEARNARKDPKTYAAERYKFAAKREEQTCSQAERARRQDSRRCHGGSGAQSRRALWFQPEPARWRAFA
jgi:hypothetical protein